MGEELPTKPARYLHLVSGEEAAYHAVDTILAEGGKLLWEAHLKRKSFPFSASTTSENLVAHLKMCFVPHDTGCQHAKQEGAESEDDERWDLEEEPVANRIDSWARMHLQTKRRVRLDAKVSTAADTLSSQRSGRASTLGTRGRGGPGASGKKDKKGVKELGSRAEKIIEEPIIDEEEDHVREMKEREEKQRKEAEARQRVLDREREDARRKLESLHEEMKVRQFTYDSLGNLIWVDYPNTEKLPKVTEQCPFSLREPKGKKEVLDIPPPPVNMMDPKEKKKADRLKKKKGKLSKQDEYELMGFTDSFTRLKHEQPPIIDTMEVQPGVDLEFQGKSKKGPRPEQSDQMSRKEYKELVDGDYGLESAGKAASSAAEEDTTLNLGEDKAPSKDPISAPGELPPLRGAPSGGMQVPSGRRPRGDSGKDFSASLPAGDSTWGQNPEFDKTKVVRLPAAPSFVLRNKRESVGHLGRNPRMHLGPLGQTHGYRFPQPVLGATMGHGLLRAGSLKEGFFFPEKDEALLQGLTSASGAARQTLSQSKSETMLNSSWGSRPLSTLYEPLPPLGNIKADRKTAAYRNVRTLMGYGEEFSAYKSQESDSNDLVQ